jgi:hypothetical protein
LMAKGLNLGSMRSWIQFPCLPFPLGEHLKHLKSHKGPYLWVALAYSSSRYFKSIQQLHWSSLITKIKRKKMGKRVPWHKVSRQLQYDILTTLKSENDHGRCDMTQMTTFWLEVLELITILTVQISHFHLKWS